MEVFDDDVSAYKLTEKLAPEHNITIYVIVNFFLLTLQIIEGAFGISFAGNLFLGLSIILFLLAALVVAVTPNKDFAKTRKLGWWSVFPLLQGFVSVGFGWWFCWILWLSIFAMMMTKKLIADAEIAKAVVKSGAGSVPVSPILTDPAADEIRETWNGWRS